MKNTRYIIPLLLLGGVSAYAQNKNLNPTVQVTNAYERRMVSSEREAQKVFVPDSLYKFDLNFDYGGFDKPYGGLENFNPYWTELELAARPYDGRKLYLKAGAGYNLAPVLDLSYSALEKGRFKLGVHALNNSYLGRYWNIRPMAESGDLVAGKAFGSHMGYSVDSRAGLDARVDWDRLRLGMNLDYEGVQTENDARGMEYTKDRRQYNGVDVNILLDSNVKPNDASFSYSARLGYSFGVASSRFFDPAKVEALSGRDYKTENNVRAALQGRYRFNRGNALDVALKADITFGVPKYTMDDYVGGVVTVVPQYFFNTSDVHLGVGAALMFADGKVGKGKMGNRSVFSAFPALEFRWNAVRDKLDLYADARTDGKVFGERQKSLKYKFWMSEENVTISKNYVLDAGLRGNIREVAHYDLSFGWEKDDMKPFAAVMNGPFGPWAGLRYVNTDDIFAAFALKTSFSGFSIDADICYRYYLGASAKYIGPSDLETGLKLGYNHMNRIVCNVGVRYDSQSRVWDYNLPGFVNLTADVKWFVTPRLAVFLEGDNLACQTIQYVPLYARKGICITGGIILNL